MNKAKKVASFFIFSAVMFFVLSFYSFSKVNSLVLTNIDMIHNSYVDDYDISNTSIETLNKTLDNIEKTITSAEITFIINGKEYKYDIEELGVYINKDEIKDMINSYENKLDYWDLYNNYSKNSFDKQVYDYQFIVDDEKLDKFLNNLKKRIDKTAKVGHLEMQSDRNLKYVGEVVGFTINKEKAKEAIKENFKVKNYNQTITIEGDSITLDNPLKVINTKISSFTTEFDATVSRKYNLMAGAKHLDGKIIEPHTTFSFFENAGPYTGINEYVYYLGVMGNGVCQVATTLYNAELLAGLTTVERYNHGKKSVYVDGGRDATVAVTSGIVTDFKFRNDYDYPVYISAFVVDDKLTIEFWSNGSVLDGKEYRVESERLGYGTYKAYRKTFKDGQLINTEDLGYSYYFSE